VINDVTSPHKYVVNVIDVPRKVSRPKVKSTYEPEPVYTDVDEGHFICPDLGHTALRVINWEPGKRSETIAFSKEKHQAFLDKIQFEADTTSSVKNRILEVIRKFWDV
jgi:hypothetical protein